MQIQELLRDAGIKVYEHGDHHHVTPGWLGINCPFCGPNEARLGIPLARPIVASCWTCGSHSMYDVLIQLGGSTLARRLKKVEFNDLLPKAVSLGRLRRPKGLKRIDNWRERAYLAERNIDPEFAEAVWKIQAIGLHTRYAWSLYIPITLDGDEVSFTTRHLSNLSLGYQNASPDEEAVPAKNVLYGADLARNGIVVCEGPFDAMRIGVGGCATLGVAYTKAQVLQMSRFRTRVVCFDAEPRAQLQARKLCDQLSVFPGTTTNAVLESDKDPSRASEREVRELREMIR